VSAADPFGLVGQVLDGQFRVDKLVGEGGFSAVYQGHHQGLNEPIAVKCLKLPTTVGPSLVDTFVQRFRDESRILYRLSQGNLHVVRSIAAGTTPSPATGALVPYMVLEWLEGRTVQSDFTVRRSIGQKGRSLEVVRTLFETAADGLAYAHAQGVVHRDLNPGNLFLARTKLGVTMKVLDFGVAKLMHEGALDMGPRAQTTGHIRIFAPAYGAPEQFDDRLGAVGASADVYAFALILLEALLDKSVVEAGNLGEYARRATDPSRRPTPRALGLEVSDEVEQVFARATALDPAQRWPSAREFWQALTIAQKLSTERAYEQAARETPSLPAAGVPGTLPLPGARGEPANPARTMPLNALGPEQLSSVARAGTAGAASREAPRRARMATTIGIPAPAGSSAQPPRAPVAPVAAAPAPARPAVPTVGAPKDAPARLPFPSQPPRATPVPPPAVAPRGGARADSSPP
jgi:serine/threonine-protein kinase